MTAAVVVTFSAPHEVLDRCLRALRATPGIGRTIVVDTGGSAEVPADLEPAVELHRMENRGYGAAANEGIRIAGPSRRVVVANDDVVVQPGWLEPLVDALAADGVGAAQPIVVGPDHAIVTSAGVQLDRFGAGSDLGDGGPVPRGSGPIELEVFNGAAVLFDAEFIDATGGFDERFFLYYEDVDLALRGAALGWRYRLVPGSRVEHRRGTTTSTLGDRTRFLQERNRLWTAARHLPPATIVGALGLSARRLRHEPKDVHRRALLAGTAGMPRRVVERLVSHDRRP